MSKEIVLLLFAVFLVKYNAGDAEKRLVLHDDESVIATIHRFEAELATLNATLRKQILDLQTALTAETKERCQSGSMTFHHEECAKGQCDETQTVSFSPAFQKTPVFSHGMTMLDVSANHNLRMNFHVSSLTATSVRITGTVWGDSITYYSVVNWMACPHA